MGRYSWIKVKKYVDDPSLSWEERYRRLEAHHKEETEFLISEVERLRSLDLGAEGPPPIAKTKSPNQRSKLGFCGVEGCGLPQYRTPSGLCCDNGHGGAPTLPVDPNTLE